MVIIKAKLAKNLWQNSQGLLFAKTPFPILLRTHFGIHTFFLKFPLDVVILDSKNQVKFLKPNLKPNQLYFWNFLYDKILELPVGEIQKRGLKIGTVVKIEAI